MKSQGTRKMKLHWVCFFVMVSLALALTSTSLKAEGTWARKADMPTPRSYSAAAVVDGIICVIGGYSSKVIRPSPVEAYDPATDTWTKKENMPTARWFGFGGGVAPVVDGIIYAMGVETALSTPTQAVEAYDPATNTWTKKSDKPS